MTITPNAIYLKKVSEIMDEYKSAYTENGDWSETMKMFLNSKSDKKVIEELQRQYNKYGKFREAITLVGNEEEDQPNLVADGTHRLIAAFLMNVEEVLIMEGYSEPETMHYLYSVVTSKSGKITDEQDDLIFENLRSVPIDDEIWLTCGVAGMDNGSIISIYWDSSRSDKIPEINAMILAVLKECTPGMEYDVETIVYKEDSVWDDEDLWH